MASCDIKVVGTYTNTGTESILYKDLLEHFDQEESVAYNYWLEVQGKKYKHLHQQLELIDVNGELTLAATLNNAKLKQELEIDFSTAGSAVAGIMRDVRIAIDKRLAILNSRITNLSEKDSKTVQDIKVLQALKVRAEEAKQKKEFQEEVTFLADFTQEIYNIVTDAVKHLNQIQDKSEQVPDDIKKLRDIYDTFGITEVFTNIERLFADELLDQSEHSNFSNQINDISRMRRKLERDYISKGIPLIADWLLDYAPKKLENSLISLIDNIRGNRRTKFVEKNADYKKLKRLHKEGTLTSTEFRDEVVRLSIQQLKDKSLISRASLIESMKRSIKDKSSFSYLFDPIMYSSDKSIGLFAKVLKEALYKANMISRNTAQEMENVYNEYVNESGKNSSNAARFNEDIIEEIEIWNPHEQKYVKQLAFVQQYKVDEYYKKINEFYKNLDDEVIKEIQKVDPSFNKNQIVNSQEDKDGYADWIQTGIGQMYLDSKKKKQAKWFEKNTQPVENFLEYITEKIQHQQQLENRIAELNKQEEISLKEAIELKQLNDELIDVEQWFRRNVISIGSEITPKGELSRPAKQYENAKYNQLLKNKAAHKYYLKLLERYKEDQKHLPQRNIRSNNWDNFSYFLPSVRKESKDITIESGGNVLKTAKDGIWDAFNIRGTDTEYGITTEHGEELESLPVFYTTPVDEKHVSRDVISSILVFHNMVNEYRAKADIQANVSLFKDIIENRDTAELNDAGQTKIDAFASKFGVKSFIKKKGQSQNFKHLEGFIDMVFYNKHQVKSFFGGVNLNKISGLLAKFTGINALAGNFLQATNNVILGNTLMQIEAFGGQYYTRSDWRKANAIYWRNKAALADVGRFNAKTKLGQIIEVIDPLQGDYRDSFGRNITGSLAKKAWTSDALFLAQHAGEHQMHVTTMLALMNNTKLKDKDGKPLSLYDAFTLDKNGKLTLDERADININDFRNIVHGINGKLHGKYNSFDKSMLQRHWYGQLFMLFRGWIVPGLRRRFGSSFIQPQIDIETGQLTEGIYVSFIRLIRESIQDKTNMLKTATPMERANFIKTVSEIIVGVSAAIIIKALSTLDLDDDDEEIYFILYQVRRLQTELSFYVKPSEFWRIVKSPTATINTVNRMSKLLRQLSEPFETYERRSGFNKKGSSKLWARTRDLIPILNNLEKSATPSESYNWFSKVF